MTRRSSQANIIDSSAKTGGYTVEVRRYEAGWWAFRFTPNGIVEMYADRLRSGKAYTRLVFIHAGRRYERTFDAFYGPTWAARLATEFARDVVEGRVE